MEQRKKKKLQKRKTMIDARKRYTEEEMRKEGREKPATAKRTEAMLEKAYSETLGRQVEDTIRDGTPEQKAMLCITLWELGITLSDQQAGRLLTVVAHNRKNWERFHNITEMYDMLEKYGKAMLSIYKSYIIELTELAALLTELRGYEMLGEFASRAYKTIIVCDRPEEKPTAEKLIKEMEVMNIINKSAKRRAVSYDYKDGLFVVRKDKEGELFIALATQVNIVNRRAAELKAYIDEVKDYLYISGYWYLMPYNMEMMIEQAYGETEARRLIDKRYLKSEINRRRREGKKVTPEQEQEAVLEDMNEMEADAETREYCKGEIYGLIHIR